MEITLNNPAIGLFKFYTLQIKVSQMDHLLIRKNDSVILCDKNAFWAEEVAVLGFGHFTKIASQLSTNPGGLIQTGISVFAKTTWS